HRTDGARRLRGAAGIAVSRAPADDQQRLDSLGVAREREQPARAGLRAHARGREAGARGDRGVGADRERHQGHSARRVSGGTVVSLLSQLCERARSLLFRRRVEADLDEELRFHIDRETEERVRQGQTPDSARRDALLALGGVEQRKEDVRDARGTRPLEDLAADLRYALRALRREPMFAISATFVLALGIGATSA